MKHDPKIQSELLEFVFEPKPQRMEGEPERPKKPQEPEEPTPPAVEGGSDQADLSHRPDDDSAETQQPVEEELAEGEPEDDILTEIREELAASSTESRRNTRRVFEILKQFGGVLDALSATVNDLHATSRNPAAATPPPQTTTSAQPDDLIELADRVDRIASAFARKPSRVRTWWPWNRRELEAWRTDRARLAESVGILSTHISALLKGAGLERIPCEGQSFDPACMRAVEAVLDPSVADHTVLAELLPGWRETGTGRMVRPASVRVSRSRSFLEKSLA